MSAFGERLKDERERLGHNQEAFGLIGGVKRNAQANYERGDRTPDSDYLAAIGAAGADVLYILMGRRETRIPDTLRDEEFLLLDKLRSLPDSDRVMVGRVVELAYLQVK